ncbi:MAG: UvrB/UvrC motif-containing protein [Selenomonadaceae bacterium]
MLCDDCKKNEACVHITEISTAGKTDKNLCEKCAAAYGNIVFDAEKGFSVNDFLKGIFSSAQQRSEEENLPAQPEAVCPNCGMAYSDFTHTGKIGCSVCYQTFGTRLEPLLRRIHGASTHNGKIPRRSGSEIQAKNKILLLRKELEAHVAKEEYEEAARLRDQIREIEKTAGEQVKQEG